MCEAENMTDSDLYARFKDGDRQAYDQLLIRYGDDLTMYLYGYLHDWQDAEDMMIEAFASIMAKSPQIAYGNFKAYLFRTGRNLSLRFWERKFHFKTFSLDSVDPEMADGVLTGSVGGQGTAPDAEVEILDREQKATVLSCIDRIEPELREVLFLVYVEELSYAQASKIMGVNVKRIDHMLSRGKAKMREELEKEGITSSLD